MKKTFCDWCEAEVQSFSNEVGRMKARLSVSGEWCEGCVRAVFDFIHERTPPKRCDVCGLDRKVSKFEVAYRGALCVASMCRECQTKAIV